MCGEVDQPDLLAVALRNLHVPADPVLQPIGEGDRAVRDHGGKRGAAEHFGDRADAHEGVAIWLLVAAVGDLAKAAHRGFAVADDADNQPRHLRLQIDEGAGEIGCFVEQFVGARGALANAEPSDHHQQFVAQEAAKLA